MRLWCNFYAILTKSSSIRPKWQFYCFMQQWLGSYVACLDNFHKEFQLEHYLSARTILVLVTFSIVNFVLPPLPAILPIALDKWSPLRGLTVWSRRTYYTSTVKVYEALNCYKIMYNVMRGMVKAKISYGISAIVYLSHIICQRRVLWMFNRTKLLQKWNYLTLHAQLGLP